MSILTLLTRKTAHLLLPQSQYAVDLHDKSLDFQTPSAYLTFDDGPHPEYTPHILEQLAKLNAKATFFLLGKHAQRWPNIVRQIVTEGHSVGTHSWSHWSARKVSSTSWIEDVQRARNEVEAITGEQCCLFRPPYGELTPLSLIALLRTRTRIIQWSQDTKDFEATSPAQFRQWFIDNQPTSGTIVLMHDNQDITSNNLHESCLHWQPNVDFCAIPMVMNEYGKD